MNKDELPNTNLTVRINLKINEKGCTPPKVSQNTTWKGGNYEILETFMVISFYAPSPFENFALCKLCFLCKNPFLCTKFRGETNFHIHVFISKCYWYKELVFITQLQLWIKQPVSILSLGVDVTQNKIFASKMQTFKQQKTSTFGPLILRRWIRISAMAWQF